MTNEDLLKLELKNGSKVERMLFNYFKGKLDLIKPNAEVSKLDFNSLSRRVKELESDIEISTIFLTESIKVVNGIMVDYGQLFYEYLKGIDTCDICLVLLDNGKNVIVTNTEIQKRISKIGKRLDVLYKNAIDDMNLNDVTDIMIQTYKKIKTKEYSNILSSNQSPNALCEACANDLFKGENRYLDMVRERGLIYFKNKKKNPNPEELIP